MGAVTTSPRLEPARPVEAAFPGEGVAEGLLCSGGSPLGQAALFVGPCLGLLARFTGRSRPTVPHLLGNVPSLPSGDQWMLLGAGVLLEILFISGSFSTTKHREPARRREFNPSQTQRLNNEQLHGPSTPAWVCGGF